MKIWGKIIASGLTFLIGIGVGFSAYHLRVLDRAAADSKVHWLVCGVHQSALRDRAEQYHQKYGRWPTNVQALVEAHFLPEFSEVHFCPSQVSPSLRVCLKIHYSLGIRPNGGVECGSWR
jgi:hypothetical protein